MKWQPFNRVVFLFLLITCLFQAPTYAGEDPARYALAHYSNENGLPQNSIKAIVADEYGFIWLATESGLVRFDGRHFVLFNRYNTGMTSSRLIDIWRTPAEGTLTAITQNWTLLGISKGKVYHEKRKSEDLYQRLWSLRQSTCLLPQSWEYRGWPSPYHLDSLQLYLGHDTALLVTLNGDIRWYHQRRLLGKIHVPALKKMHNVFTLSSSVYVLPDDDPAPSRLYHISRSRIDTVSLTGDILRQPGSAIKVLCLNNAMRQVFLYCDRYFYLVHRQANGDLGTTLLLQGYDFEKLGISSCYYDSLQQRIFLGSGTQGLYVCSAKNFTARTSRESGKFSNVFYDHVPFSDTSVLTGKGILFYANDTGYTVFPQLRNKSRGVDYNLFRARDRSLWTADFDSVYQMSPQGDKVLHRWPIPSACAFAQLASGKLWIGTNTFGIYSIRPDQPQMPALQVLPVSERVICIQPETDDLIWIATDQHLFRYRIAGRKLDTLRAFDHQVVRNIYIPRKNEVWFCTYEAGFYLFRDGKLTRFPPDRNNYLNTAHCISEDRNGFFWISTNNGIFKVARQDLLTYVNDKTKIPFYLYYAKESGFNTNEFNGCNQQVSAQLGNGSFSFASVDGIVFLYPDKLKAELPDAPLIIDGIEVNGMATPVSDLIMLDHGFSDIRIRIATAYFGHHDNLMFEYCLDGQDWLPVENESFAFNALSAGKHQLSVRKRAGFHHRYQYSNLLLHVAPAFWETWWFRIMILLLFIAAIWLLIRLRMFYLKQKNKMLEQTVTKRTSELNDIIHVLEVSETKLAEELRLQQRLIGNIAHDIKTPLKYLTLSAGHLSQKIRQKEMPEHSEAEGIYSSAVKIYAFTENLMEYLKARLESGAATKEHNLWEVVEHQRGIFDIALNTRQDIFRNEVPPGLVLKMHRQLLGIVLHNLIDNAIKHTRNGIISISATAGDDAISIRVQDNGGGIGAGEAERYNAFFSSGNIQEKEVYTGFGFLIIKDILPLLDASLTFESAEGTLAILSIGLRVQDHMPEPE